MREDLSHQVTLYVVVSMLVGIVIVVLVGSLLTRPIRTLKKDIAIVAAGDKVEEQIGIMLKDQLGKVDIDLELRKIDPGQIWDMFVSGDYDVSVAYWTNDTSKPTRTSTFTWTPRPARITCFSITRTSGWPTRTSARRSTWQST